MIKDIEYLVNLLYENNSLKLSDYENLVKGYTPALADYVAKMANLRRKSIYDNKIYIRGLIEISNICKNNCLYCGIRKDNRACSRYRLNKDEILECCEKGYNLGFRTFVMQSGEDPYYTDDVICKIIKEIKQKYDDCAVTLSLGERSYESYKNMFDAGADRYLLRHETADSEHYSRLHPSEMSLENRMKCLKELREIGYQVGCGFMVGSPYQTALTIAKDLKFIEEFKPDMCGIGPFIPHSATPFKNEDAGDVNFTCFLLSIIRLIQPTVLLPATTALGTLSKYGREKGILAGANVVMPNLSPVSVRGKYELYNNKIYTDLESAQCKERLVEEMKKIGYQVVIDRGDVVNKN